MCSGLGGWYQRKQLKDARDFAELILNNVVWTRRSIPTKTAQRRKEELASDPLLLARTTISIYQSSVFRFLSICSDGCYIGRIAERWTLRTRKILRELVTFFVHNPLLELCLLAASTSQIKCALFFFYTNHLCLTRDLIFNTIGVVCGWDREVNTARDDTLSK
jgi:hypothetical protein